MTKQTTNGALTWLDDHMIESLETPDEGFDWVYMLTETDWDVLESYWDHRPPKWREALAYIVSEGPIPESQSILRRALFDVDLQVASEAAFSLCRHFELNPDLVDLGPAVIGRLNEVFKKNGGKNMEDVSVVLAQFR